MHLILEKMSHIHISLEGPLLFVFAVFALALLVQLIYYTAVFGRLAFYKKKETTSDCPPLSVIICARNEYLNLKKYLPRILAQDYPLFEVVIVNDSSDDDTDYLLQDLKEKHPQLSIVNFKKNVNFFEGKKFPLALGIKSAKYELLVLTDADCYPSSDQWLRRMAAHYADNDKHIVLGYSPYQKRKGFLNTLIRFDTFFIGMQYLSYALAGMPYMGVGRNLSYRKDVFIKARGFSSHYHISSGDDDIFIGQVARRKNTSIEFASDAQIVSIPKTTFASWIKQKRRHFTTYPYYKKSRQFFLGLFTLSNFLFYALFITLAVLQYNIPLLLALLILRLAVQYIIFKKCLNQLSEQKLLLFSPLFDFILTIINPFTALINYISKQKKWS